MKLFKSLLVAYLFTSWAVGSGISLAVEKQATKVEVQGERSTEDHGCGGSGGG